MARSLTPITGDLTDRGDQHDGRVEALAGARRASSTNTEEPPDQPRQGFGHPQAPYPGPERRGRRISSNCAALNFTRLK